MCEYRIVFPPMSEEEFLPKFARWLKRGPKVFVPKNNYGRPVANRIPKAKFQSWILAQQQGRARAQHDWKATPRRSVP
jgi:hypothetical protein